MDKQGDLSIKNSSWGFLFRFFVWFNDHFLIYSIGVAFKIELLGLSHI